MSGDRDKRITKLEQKRKPRPKLIVAWRDAPRESEEQAIARRCPKGVPANAKLVICSWESPEEPPGPSRRQPADRCPTA